MPLPILELVQTFVFYSLPTCNDFFFLLFVALHLVIWCTYFSEYFHPTIFHEEEVIEDEIF